MTNFCSNPSVYSKMHGYNNLLVIYLHGMLQVMPVSPLIIYVHVS